MNLKPGQRLPNAFAWTGTRSLFADAGFELAGTPDDLESCGCAASPERAVGFSARFVFLDLFGRFLDWRRIQR